MTAPAPTEPHALTLQALDSPVGLVVDAVCACGVWTCAFLLSETSDRDALEGHLETLHARHLLRVGS